MSHSGVASMDVSVIVVTYDSAASIGSCLDSFRAQRGVASELVVVDNFSTDSTVERVRSLAPRSRLRANQENVGFGRACNQAYSLSRGRYLFFLNPDASLERPDALATACRAMDSQARWGLAGTQVFSLDGRREGRAATSYPEQHRVRRDFSHLPGSLAWVYGASMIVRSEVFAAVGGFDPGFFLSSEETDLCLRVRQMGWEIGFIDEVSVRHVGMGSECGRDPYETWLRRMPGLLRFWSKHYPAEDARRLARRDLLRASFREQWYGLMAGVLGPNSRAWRQHRRYAGISEAARRFLVALPEQSSR